MAWGEDGCFKYRASDLKYRGRPARELPCVLGRGGAEGLRARSGEMGGGEQSMETSHSQRKGGRAWGEWRTVGS